jgi:hypothetical protein
MKVHYLFFCDHCLFLDIFCVVIIDHFKCSEYTCHDCLYIDIFLESLNWTHKNWNLSWKWLWKNAEHSVTVVRLNLKLTWLLSQVKHNKLLFILKVYCITTELSDNNDEMKNEINFSTMLQFVNSMSSSFWNFILVSSQNIEAFLHSSWKFFLDSQISSKMSFHLMRCELSH